MADFNWQDAGAQWIWPEGDGDRVNQYVEFRHVCDVAAPSADAELLICAGSNYAAWVNGAFVGSGQFHDYPDRRSYDTLPVGKLVRPGRNVLCVLAYHQGEGSFQYISAPAGLIYALRSGSQVSASGPDALCSESPSYRSGPVPRVTGQLGFTFEYDARGDDGWRAPDYAPADGWRNMGEGGCVPLTSRAAPVPRPLHKLEVRPRCPVRVVAQGLLARETSDAPVSRLVQSDSLSARTFGEVFQGAHGTSLPAGSGGIRLRAQGGSGAYIVLDLGREEAGLLDLELEAAEGTVIDIGYGEHLEDLRVRSSVGGRNFANRFICRAGRQAFTHHFLRLAGRYLQLHIIDPGDSFTLHYAGLLPTPYPLDVRGGFQSSDGLASAIYDTSVRTLHLCMHEHYEDCPWREQALYANDARNQAVSGYYCFGEYDFPAVSLDLLGRGLRDDGYLTMCAPAEIPFTIPSFSMAWILWAADHYLFSGDREFVRKQFPVVRKMLTSYAEAMRGGLLPSLSGGQHWHFYDWAPGLEGTIPRGDSAAKHEADPRFDAPLNMLLVMALDAGDALAAACECGDVSHSFRVLADRLRPACHAAFWDAEEKTYITYTGGGSQRHQCELVQALAILSGVCPKETAPALRARLMAEGNGLVETTLSQSFHKFQALLTDPEQCGVWVFDRIARQWGDMLCAGATSFWETSNGAADFGGAGSLCHGWSGIPAYFYHAHLLGVRPAAPGFRQFVFDPVPGIVERMSGAVPTPQGVIRVEIGPETPEHGKRIEFPQGLELLPSRKGGD